MPGAPEHDTTPTLETELSTDRTPMRTSRCNRWNRDPVTGATPPKAAFPRSVRHPLAPGRGLARMIGAVVLGSAAVHAAPALQGEVQRASQVDLSKGETYEFGSQVAVDGARLLVTCRGYETQATGLGRVLVYGKSPQGWIEEDELIPNTPGHTLAFGRSLALVGDWAYVGDPHASRVYVFEKLASGWTERQVITIDDGIPGGLTDQAGSDLDVDPISRRLIVRSSYDDTLGVDTGAVYIYDPSPTGYQRTGSLFPPIPTYSNLFGFSVQIDGDRAAVGEPGIHSIPSAVHVYELQGGSWTLVDSLYGTNPTGLTAHGILALGYDVELEGDRIAAGMVGTGAVPTGAVLTFERDPSGWQQTDYLMVSMTPLSNVGYHIEMFGDQLVVGAPNRNTASVFTRKDDGTWDERQRLVPTNYGSAGGTFSASMSFDGSTLLIGADWPSALVANHSGAIYLYEDLGAPSFGESYCHGDVLTNLCPCGLDSPKLDGPGCRNSKTSGARLSAGGSASLTSADLSFRAFGMPTQKPCLLFAGTQDKGAGLPFQNGILCVGGAIRRLPAQNTTIFGDALWTGVAAGLGPVLPGDERFFQVWYRDQSLQCPAGSANLTNGFKLRLTP